MIQERVRIEIDNVMQENEGKLNMSSLQNLSYLERCIKEALRLYPSAFFILRNPREDVKLRNYLISHFYFVYIFEHVTYNTYNTTYIIECKIIN